MTDDWQVVEEALNYYYSNLGNGSKAQTALAALARLREREAQLTEDYRKFFEAAAVEFVRAEAAEARVAEDTEMISQLADRIVELELGAGLMDDRMGLLENGCEQALLLLERERFAWDAEVKVVRAVLRSALAREGEK